MFLAKTRNVEISLFVAYIFLLHISNAVFDLFVSSHTARYIHNPYLEALVGPIWKLAFWIVPTFLYVIYINQYNALTYLKLTTHMRKGLLWGIAASSLFTVGLCYRHFLQGVPLNLNLGFDHWLNMVVLVGFFEEIPFRGLVFQKLNEYMGFWPASLLGSFLFVCLHIPYWISIGKPLSSFPYNTLYIFGFAMVMCFVLKRSGSLWSCIIIHGVNDLVSLVI